MDKTGTANGYVVASADNIGLDIFVSKVYSLKSDALKMLKQTYKETLEGIEEEEVESSSQAGDMFKILITNGDFYYGQIKKIELPTT